MEKFHLGWFLPNGFGVQGWNEPGYGQGYDWKKPDLYCDMLRVLERGRFDLLIIEDTLMVPDIYQASMETYLKYAMFAPKHDPLPLVPLLAAASKHIGIVPTLSTTFYPPFLLARLLATLDHLSDGRLGWNIVTSTSQLSARNFGMDALPPHDTRYDRADEYVELCCQLWNSWEQGAVVMDEQAGVFADHTKVHRVDFEGEFYRSRGPLNVVASPQGRPVFVQAGGSPRGRAFAARHAEVVIASSHTVPQMKQYYIDVKSNMEAFDRKPDSCKVLFICVPVIVDSEDDAKAWKARAAADANESIHRTLAAMSNMLGVDLAKLDLDEPLPVITTEGNQSLLAGYYKESPVPTLREIAGRGNGAWAIDMIGTAEKVADVMEATMEEVGGDGFLVAGALRPGYVVRLVDELVPVLQRRGLTRTGYDFATFRDNLFEF